MRINVCCVSLLRIVVNLAMIFRLFAIVVIVLPHHTRSSSFAEIEISESLLEAAKEGNLQLVEDLISRGADINFVGDIERSALSLASLKGHVEVVRFLVALGADLNHIDGRGETPLRKAARLRHAKVARLLIENGADVNHVDNHGESALMKAASSGDFTIAELLVEYGAIVNHVDNDGETALMNAARSGHAQIAQFLIAKGACVSHVASTGRSALIDAVRSGHVAIVQLLITNGADVNRVDNFGNTPLKVAARGNHVDIIELLIRNGADVNQVNDGGFTALIATVRNGNVPITRLLIEQGANINHTTDSGRTALSYASRLEDTGKNRGISRLLILAGAETDSDEIINRETCIEPIFAPLTMIRNSVVGHEAVTAVLPTLGERGIHPLQGFVSFAFESLKNGIDVFRDSDIISFLRDHAWDQTKIDSVESVIHILVRLKLTDLNVLYSIAPFITTTDNKTLRRLVVSLEFLTNQNTFLAEDFVASHGRILNAMIHRSAHSGFLPVVKAIYIIYRCTVEIERVGKGLQIPDELITAIDGSSLNFEHEAMVQLSIAMRRHRGALESFPIADFGETSMSTAGAEFH